MAEQKVANREKQAEAQNATLSPGKDSASLLKNEREQAASPSGRMLAALFNTKEAANETIQSASRNADQSQQTRNSRNSNQNTSRSKKDSHHHHHEARPGERNEAALEALEQFTIRTANAALARSAGTAVGRRGGLGVGTGPRSNEPVDQGVAGAVGDQNIQEGISDAIQGVIDSTSGSSNPSINQDFQQGVEGSDVVSLVESQKLVDVVGPEAVLTFREKLQQVWVVLDDTATSQLDVVARMPATLSGASKMELLMVESPQGVHFVAFLKNKNDFDILATFDRRALLPDSPTRQLIEAGIMSYEQIDSVFKEGSQKIEEQVKAVAGSRGTSDPVFAQLQRIMVQEKRRRRRFRQWIDHLIDTLDELDLEGDAIENSFVPFKMEKDLSQIGESPLKLQLDQETENRREESEEDLFEDENGKKKGRFAA